ncbi:MAG: hypothetical protein V7L23_11420 [Nostoc sp.]
MPNVPCPMPNAQCPMPNAQCPIPHLNVRLSVAKDSRRQMMI